MVRSDHIQAFAAPARCIGDRMPGSRQDKDQVSRFQALRRGLLALVLLLIGGGVVLVLRHPAPRVATLPPLPSPSQGDIGTPGQGPESPPQPPSPAAAPTGPTTPVPRP